MTGPKLNERPVLRVRAAGAPRALPEDEVGAGSRATARYARVSPYKVREVLDLIRGHTAERATEILAFSQRDAATVVGKVLASAIANAWSTNSVPEDELFVSACYADEGPTLKRWRPRARGRATRIRKRTSHVTVIVSRLPEQELQRRRDLRPAAVAERRRRRTGQSTERGIGRRRRQARQEAESAEASEAMGQLGAEGSEQPEGPGEEQPVEEQSDAEAPESGELAESAEAQAEPQVGEPEEAHEAAAEADVPATEAKPEDDEEQE